MVILHMGNTKPFVQAACLCENVLIEKDGVPSLIRLIDKIDAQIPKDKPADIPSGFPVTFFIRLGSAEALGSGKILIQPKRPDGTLGGKIEVEVALPGKGHGVQFKAPFMVLNPQAGFYWFNVFWNGDFITSFPMEVTLTEVPQLTGTNLPIATSPTPTSSEKR